MTSHPHCVTLNNSNLESLIIRIVKQSLTQLREDPPLKSMQMSTQIKLKFKDAEIHFQLKLNQLRYSRSQKSVRQIELNL